jgi:hypothetical protein
MSAILAMLRSTGLGKVVMSGYLWKPWEDRPAVRPEDAT